VPGKTPFGDDLAAEQIVNTLQNFNYLEKQHPST
jgi:hypothetical protein